MLRRADKNLSILKTLVEGEVFRNVGSARDKVFFI